MGKSGDPDHHERLSLGFLIFFGIAWGVWEVVLAGTFKTTISRPLLGAILAGTAFFFLSAAAHSGQPRHALLLMFPLAGFTRLAAATWVTGGEIPASISGPLAAYLMQILVFLGLLTLFADRIGLSETGALKVGAAAGLIAAWLYPVFSAVMGHSACCIAGTSLPASIAYTPFTVPAAALSCRLGREIGLRLPRTQGHSRTNMQPDPGEFSRRGFFPALRSKQ